MQEETVSIPLNPDLDGKDRRNGFYQASLNYTYINSSTGVLIDEVHELRWTVAGEGLSLREWLGGLIVCALKDYKDKTSASFTIPEKIVCNFSAIAVYVVLGNQAGNTSDNHMAVEGEEVEVCLSCPIYNDIPF